MPLLCNMLLWLDQQQPSRLITPAGALGRSKPAPRTHLCWLAGDRHVGCCPNPQHSTLLDGAAQRTPDNMHIAYHSTARHSIDGVSGMLGSCTSQHATTSKHSINPPSAFECSAVSAAALHTGTACSTPLLLLSTGRCWWLDAQRCFSARAAAGGWMRSAGVWHALPTNHAAVLAREHRTPSSHNL